MRKILFQSIIVYACIVPCFADSTTWVSFESRDLGLGQWEYTYQVANVDLTENDTPAAIKEFTIWFDPGLYVNLIVTTPTPLSNTWDEIVWQPELVLHDAGGYDALAEIGNLGIMAGQSVKGFSVKFNWLGEGSPGSQRYEIVNPLTFETIDAGVTIPEPATLLLLGLGGLLLQKHRKNI